MSTTPRRRSRLDSRRRWSSPACAARSSRSTDCWRSSGS
jgi:hypothetical protein